MHIKKTALKQVNHSCRYLFLALFFCFSITLKAQSVQQQPPENTRILFLLDASGSMLGPWGNDLKIHQAKAILSELVDSLRVNPHVELALRVYGHQFARQVQNCEDSRLEVPFSTKNHDIIIDKLQDIKPKGTTPIAYSLEQAAHDFPKKDNIRNIVIIITDGLESCGGDPCALSAALQRNNIFLRPFVIGLGMKNYAGEFDCVGRYFNATNVNAFQNFLNEALKQSLNKTTVSVELLDIADKPTETNVNVSFINAVNKETIYDFVHYRDDRGRPDSVEIDAILTYDIRVNTIPPVYRRNVIFEGGQHNVLNMKTPQGGLLVNMPGYREYRNGITTLVRKANSPEIIHRQPVADQERYLVGSYDLEVLTLPPTFINDVKIKQGEITKVNVSSPGLLNIIASARGIGSIYELKDGNERFVTNLPNNKNNITIALQPGSYKLVFRATNANGSKYSRIKKFAIKSGSTTNIDIFK